ncbi:hypothetical protein JAAARDRAFT_128755 [Jaapia argillacea MUCL 33604]|uniref:Protein-S-isoprenylcysteine O-methyltransferase n=1 Tax=Jaapia argillacea MUCL 33604 TaxID=933084 RepID=A0A067PV56_9AGAM|nr:hypothetical protein JAAARDRAFT_128755 [Jaapia argillacea MUCL 33604]
MASMKIALLLAVAASTHISATPPQPAPSNENKVKMTFGQAVFTNSIRYSMAALKYVVWLGSLLECALLLAIAYPSPHSTQIIHALSPHHLPNLHMTPMFLLGSFLCIFASTLRSLCYRELGRHFTFEMSIFDNHKLVQTGPYSIVRHPSYLGTVTGLPGIALTYFGRHCLIAESGWMGTLSGKAFVGFWLFYLAFASSSVVMRAPVEDECLRKQFGKEWDNWAKRVPSRIIPGIY